MFVDHAHVRRCVDADFAQERDRLLTRQIELFCELVNSNSSHPLSVIDLVVPAS